MDYRNILNTRKGNVLDYEKYTVLSAEKYFRTNHYVRLLEIQEELRDDLEDQLRQTCGDFLLRKSKTLLEKEIKGRFWDRCIADINSNLYVPPFSNSLFKTPGLLRENTVLAFDQDDVTLELIEGPSCSETISYESPDYSYLCKKLFDGIGGPIRYTRIQLLVRLTLTPLSGSIWKITLN